MKTVKQLRDDLAKFPDDAVCFAYEGEICGLIISRKGESYVAGKQGHIICTGDPEETDDEVKLIDQLGESGVTE